MKIKMMAYDYGGDGYMMMAYIYICIYDGTQLSARNKCDRCNARPANNDVSLLLCVI